MAGSHSLIFLRSRFPLFTQETYKYSSGKNTLYPKQKVMTVKTTSFEWKNAPPPLEIPAGYSGTVLFTDY